MKPGIAPDHATHLLQVLHEHRNNSVHAVSRAFDGGTETFVLGVNFDDNHLQDLANAGIC